MGSSLSSSTQAITAVPSIMTTTSAGAVHERLTKTWITTEGRSVTMADSLISTCTQVAGVTRWTPGTAVKTSGMTTATMVKTIDAIVIIGSFLEQVT